MEDVNNEELFVVIVGDEDALDADSKNQLKQEIKQEILDEDTEMAIEELIETAEKYGEPVEIGYLKKEPIDEYGLEIIDNDDVDDEDYIQDFSDEDSDEEYNNKKKRLNPSLGRRAILGHSRRNERQRHKLRTREEQQSFVEELRQEHPELVEDQELLIDTVARIMLDIQRPTPPKDFFIMNNIMFECVECGAMKQTMPAISRHWLEKHGPRYLICLACGVDFRSTTNLYKHEKRCNSPDAVIVLKARARTLGRKGRGRPFLVSKRAIRKLEIFKDKKRFQCSYCSADFSCKPALQSHEFKHTGARPFRCELCPAAYTSALGLKRHRRKHTDIQFICDHCKRPFKCRSALIVHLDTHKPLRKFPCDECGKRFAQKMALQLHVDRVHRRLPPPCACQMCPKRYPRMSLLKQHMLREHGMTLMTRKMFYKSLPMLTETQLQQAKVVLKSELDPSRDLNNTKPKDNDDSQDDTQGNLTEELMEYINNMHLRGGHKDTDSKYIVIHNGEAICVDGARIDLYKSNLISDLEEELEQHLEFEVFEDNKQDVLAEIEALKKQNETGEILYENDETQDEILCETSGIVRVRQSDEANTMQCTESVNVPIILSRKERKKN